MIGEFYEENIQRRSSTYSRYKECKLLSDIDTGDKLLSCREWVDIPNRGLDTYHTVSVNEVERLDVIAHNYYKNPLLWWVIAQANNIYDPLSPLEPNTILRIPNIESLYGNNGILL